MSSLYVANTLPETMIALICLNPDSHVIATSPYASRRLDELGINYETAPSITTTRAEIDELGYNEFSGLGKDDGYDLSDGLYPDRLRFWVDPREVELRQCIDVYIESNLMDSLSWYIAKQQRKAGSRITVVKSNEEMFSSESLLAWKTLGIDRVIVSTESEMKAISLLTSTPCQTVDSVSWQDKPRKPITEEGFNSLRDQLRIKRDIDVLGIVWTPRDDWKLISLFQNQKIGDYILFFKPEDRERFLKSVPRQIRSNALYCLDDMSPLVNVCNTVAFPRYTNQVNLVASNHNIVFYDFNTGERNAMTSFNARSQS